MPPSLGWIVQPALFETPVGLNPAGWDLARCILEADEQHIPIALQAGFDTIWVEDHMGWGDKSHLECMTTLAWLAARHAGPRWGTMVCGQAFRNPAYLAKLAVNLQLLTEDIGARKLRMIADSAEPKSIEELRRLGYSRIEGALKGPDSIRNGLDILKHYHLNKHKEDVARYYHYLSEQTFGSEVASKNQKRLQKYRDKLFVFLAEPEASPTNNGSEQALRWSAVFRKVTNCFRSVWGARLHAEVRSVIETARRRGIGALEAILLTLRGQPLPVPA